jgi:hypothetical protein
MKTKSVTVLVVFLIAAIDGLAQASDTSFLANSIRYAKTIYSRALENDSPLYTGSEYKELPKLGDGHPFFLQDDFVEGEITYDQQRYEHVPLLMDLVQGEILTERNSDAVKIKLVQEHISEFIIANHKFVKLIATSSNELSSSGFYEVLCPGSASAYAKWQKERLERLIGNRMEVTIVETLKYFIEKDGKFIPVKNRNSVIQAFKDQKPFVRQFIKKNRIKFGEDRGKGIAKVTEYYNGVFAHP